MEESLDPRINRLPGTGEWQQEYEKDSLDQFPTFEVFVQAKEDKPFQHEGIVHAPEPNFAFLFAKEQFSRRYSCSGIWVVNTQNVIISDYTENSQNIYDIIAQHLKSYNFCHIKQKVPDQAEVVFAVG